MEARPVETCQLGERAFGIFVSEGMRLMYDKTGKLIDAELGAFNPATGPLFGWFAEPEDAELACTALIGRMGNKAEWSSKHSPWGHCGACNSEFRASEPHSELMIWRASVKGGMEEHVNSVRFCPKCAGLNARAQIAVAEMLAESGAPGSFIVGDTTKH